MTDQCQTNFNFNELNIFSRFVKNYTTKSSDNVPKVATAAHPMPQQNGAN